MNSPIFTGCSSLPQAGRAVKSIMNESLEGKEKEPPTRGWQKLEVSSDVGL
jgi:hypothetical protein